MTTTTTTTTKECQRVFYRQKSTGVGALLSAPHEVSRIGVGYVCFSRARATHHRVTRACAGLRPESARYLRSDRRRHIDVCARGVLPVATRGAHQHARHHQRHESTRSRHRRGSSGGCRRTLSRPHPHPRHNAPRRCRTWCVSARAEQTLLRLTKVGTWVIVLRGYLMKATSFPFTS